MEEIIKPRKDSLSSDDLFSLISDKSGGSNKPKSTSEGAEPRFSTLSTERKQLNREEERYSLSVGRPSDSTLPKESLSEVDHIENEGLVESRSSKMPSLSRTDSKRISTKEEYDIFNGRKSFFIEEQEYLQEEANYGSVNVSRETSRSFKKMPQNVQEDRKRCMPCVDGFMDAVIELLGEKDEQTEEDEVKTSCDGLPKPPKEVAKDPFANLTTRQQQALQYLKEKKIEELFHYLITHVLWQVPGDPLAYLSTLCHKFIQFRNGTGDPCLVFDIDEHTSIYTSLDPSGAGVITYQQYCKGLETMFLKDYDKEPRLTENGLVEKETFLKEADRCALSNFVELICTCKGTTEEMKDQLKIRKIKVRNILSDHSIDPLSDVISIRSGISKTSKSSRSSRLSKTLKLPKRAESEELNIGQYHHQPNVSKNYELNTYYDKSPKPSSFVEKLTEDMISSELIDSQAKIVANLVADIQQEVKMKESSEYFVDDA